ncbi:MAG: TonB-dependent receptor plug domain-containing protein [Myxococcota bacterium]
MSDAEANEEIVIEARRDPPAVSEQTLDRERVLQTPGTFEDPVRLVQSLPGAAVTPEYGPQAGDVAVRGSGPGENRFLLDGIDLPYLFHFNGYSSVIHTRLLDELTLAPSTFGAPWGDATGAIVDTRSTWERPARARGSVNLNAIMAGGETAVPIGERWAVRGSARRSYLDAFDRDSEQYTVFPVFWDHFARVEHTPSPRARWGLLSFGAGDHYVRYAGEPTLLDPWERTVNPTFDYTQQFQIAALTHRHVLQRGRAEGNVAFTWHAAAGTLPDASERQTTFRLQAREDAAWSVADRVSLAFGAEARVSRVSLTAATDRPWTEVEREAPLLARGLAVDALVDRGIAGAYAEGRLSFGVVRLVPGVRVDGDTLSGEVAVDPRFNARWYRGDTRVRLAAGQYSQFPSTLQLAPVVGDPTLGRATSRQVAAGVETAIAGRWEVGVEGYGKWSEGLVEQDLGEAPVGGIEGRAYGVELTSRYRLRERFFAWVSAALARAERDGETFDYDQPWAFNVVASWSFLPTWSAGARYRAAAGLPYTPVEDGLYLGADDTYAPIFGETNGARLPAYQKVDVHLEKTFRGKGWSLTAYGEVWWVPSGSNTMYLVHRYDYDASEAVHGPALLPLVGVRGEL